MKAPAKISELSLAGDTIGTGGTYPPLGFRPVWDAELGNGDYYGLYWPYGREDRDPIVCDMLHDEWGMEIAFSSVEVFVEWLEANGHQRGDEEVADSALVTGRFHGLKPLLQNQPEEAVAQLRTICDDFPESAEYWFTLATQLRRLGDHVGCHEAAVRAFASNWVFGSPPNGTTRMIQNVKHQTDDPLTQRIGEFTTQYGGAKENSNYELLKECIAEYLSSETPVLGLLLNQNYGYMMSMETVSFQEWYQFDVAEWLYNHSQLCEMHVGDSRTSITIRE